ncbi:hypothetical protein [Microbispora sp. CA-102843]|uniref:hypothetical protein n=1 Tax=Microbispora sp. CA-102843 TaxID=3239952 RepID=UPI003D9331E9
MRALRSLPVQYEVRQGFAPPPRRESGADGDSASRPEDVPGDGDRRPSRPALWVFLHRLRGGRRDDHQAG